MFIMLTDVEKERLTNRDELDTKTKARNEFVVRNKLKSWLDDSTDVLYVLEHLEDRQLRKIIADDNAFTLYELTEKITTILNFDGILRDGSGAFVGKWFPDYPTGDPFSPIHYEWRPIRRATETDLKREEHVKKHIYNLLNTLQYSNQIRSILKKIIVDRMNIRATREFIKEIFRDLMTRKDKEHLLNELQKDLCRDKEKVKEDPPK